MRVPASWRTAAAGTAILTSVVTAAEPAGRSPDDPVVVRVYDGTSGHGRTRSTAIRTASAIVADAGLVMDWTDCSRGSQAGACNGLRGRHDLIVRIVPVASAGHPGLLIRDQTRAPLGYSVVDPAVGAGAIAMVFLDRVLTLARRTGVDSGRLLGRAIAHEIGHLLAGTTAHTANGLMRDVWTDEELARNRPEDWVFLPRIR